jgi:hypothetical protein
METTKNKSVNRGMQETPALDGNPVLISKRTVLKICAGNWISDYI